VAGLNPEKEKKKERKMFCLLKIVAFREFGQGIEGS